uniref:Uncharacterized protein n=1 Tax=Ixodes ricinus TaxID=34613 RepID=A0A0K8RB28_IXORI
MRPETAKVRYAKWVGASRAARRRAPGPTAKRTVAILPIRRKALRTSSTSVKGNLKILIRTLRHIRRLARSSCRGLGVTSEIARRSGEVKLMYVLICSVLLDSEQGHVFHVYILHNFPVIAVISS